METSNDCFVAALQKKLKEQGRGAKKKLAAHVGVSPNHLSDILAERKNAGQKLKERVADALGISFEEMLALGRHLIESQSSGKVINDVSVDDRDNGLLVTGEPESAYTTDFMAMASRILGSNTPYRQALISNITAYHQALEFAQKEQEALKTIKELQKELSDMRQEVDTLKRPEEGDEDSSRITTG
jgi:plasmid maintenance system antidote protein VapI